MHGRGRGARSTAPAPGYDSPAMSAPLRIIVAVTGASGAAFARALVRKVASSPRVAELHFLMSDAARRVASDELGTSGSAVDIAKAWLQGADRKAEIVIHPVRDVGASIASGSFAHDGMIVIPCTAGTAASIAHGTTQNLIHRAAECCLKERRKLIVMLRESPLSLISLRNLVTLSEAGAIVMPISPPFYHRPQTVDDVVDDTLGRALDHLGLPELAGRRWDGGSGDARA